MTNLNPTIIDGNIKTYETCGYSEFCSLFNLTKPFDLNTRKTASIGRSKFNKISRSQGRGYANSNSENTIRKKFKTLITNLNF